MSTLFILFIVFQLKHFVADYPLQNKFMLGKFKEGWDFFPPLMAHVAVHAAFTFVIVWLFSADWLLGLGLGCLDAAIHFVMDRIKAGPKYLGRFKNIQEPAFWISLGVDQMVHHMTHYLIIWILVSRGIA